MGNFSVLVGKNCILDQDRRLPAREHRLKIAIWRGSRENRETPWSPGGRSFCAKGPMIRSAFLLLCLIALCLTGRIAHAAGPGPLYSGRASGPTWILRGKILPSASGERRHYAIGLFPVLGGDGLPVCYPVVQEILPAGQRAFRLRVPLRLTRAYLFAELVEEGSGRRRWIVPTANPWTPATPQPAELFL